MSFTTYYPTGQPYIVEERVNGIRKGIVYIYGTAGQKISAMGHNYEQSYFIASYQNNLLHNEHGPAYMAWHNGQIYYIDYQQNGRYHKLYSPAIISWDINNNKFNYISYRQNNLLHNLHGPARTLWSNGIIYRINFYHFGEIIKEYKF